MPDVQTIAAGVRVLPVRTPTLPPATHTNCLIVGDRELAVIEPATPYERDRRALDAVLDALVAGGARVVAILLTHHHQDHVGYAAGLRERTGAPLHAHPLTAARVPFPIDRPIEDGARIDLDGGHALEAVFTPGHAPGHLVFHDRASGVAYAGDMVAGTGTILIDPSDDGDMARYLESLERLGRLGARALVPSHGPVLDDPAAATAKLVAHRLMRERKVLEAIAPTGSTTAEVLARAYDDTSMLLWPLAARSLEAHLVKLEREGRVARDGDAVRRI